jgi:Glycosyltransferase family 87
MSLATRFKIPIWIAVWVLTRGLMVVLVGFWLPSGPQYQDVDLYHAWSQFMVDTGGLPNEELWQYPPGAAFVMLAPRLSWGEFDPSFMVLMVAVDLVGFWLMTRFAKEEGRDVGVWVWLLALPLLATLQSWGGMPLLRFDLVPTVLAMAGLLVIHRRPSWFGVLAGIGASIKVWPIFILFGEWNRKRLRRSAWAVLASIAAVVGLVLLVLGDPFGFLGHQGGRGLQVESVGALPWKIREVITGEGQFLIARYGSNEIASSLGDAVAKALDIAALLVLVGAAVWWRLRDRGIRAGRAELEDVALSRDFVFTVVLLFVVVSRVLSPQYMIWLVGLSAIVLTSRRTRIARAAWLTVASIVLTAGVVQAMAITLVTRNLLLLYAAIDAAVVLSVVLLRPGEDQRREPSDAVEGRRHPEPDSLAETT